jgi:hypothetical protein
VLDLLYVIGSVAFFAAMLAYVAGCERLGRSDDLGASSSEVRS